MCALRVPVGLVLPLLLCATLLFSQEPPYCSLTAPDGTLVELRIDSPLPGSTITAMPPCPPLEVTGVASTIGIPPRLDLFVVINRSGSTKECSGVDVDGDGRICYGSGDSILAAEVAAVRTIVDQVNPAHVRMALITFASTARVDHGLTSDFAALRASLSSILAAGSSGGTNFVAAIDKLREEFAASAEPDTRLPISFFLSDGRDDPLGPIQAAALRAAQDGIRIDTFGVGEGADPIALQEIASITGGVFTLLMDPGEIMLALPRSILVGIELISVENLTTGELVTGLPAIDGSFSLELPHAAGRSEIRVSARADNPDGSVVTCNTDVTVNCGNRPPELSCLTPVVCTDPVSCSAAMACDSVALCSDPDGDSVSLGCVPPGPYQLATTQVSVSCSDGFASVTSTCPVEVVDCEPPVCNPPQPIELECTSHGGIRGDDPDVLDWLAEASTSDNCHLKSFVNDAPDSYASGCEPGEITRVTWTATDDADNVTTCDSELTVVDTLPPSVEALLEPLEPLPPSSAASARSVCSPAASRSFRIVCGGGDDVCDPEPARLSAMVEVTHCDLIDPQAACQERVEAFSVECDEVIEIRLLPPHNPASPGSPRSSLSVNSEGVKVFSGESVILEVTASDNCLNQSTARFNPAEEPSPLCDEVLPDGTCCPAIAQPEPPQCPASVLVEPGAAGQTTTAGWTHPHPRATARSGHH